MNTNTAPTLGVVTPLVPTPRWEPAESYPDPAIRTLDPRFESIKPPFNAAVERLATGFRWGRRPGVVRRWALPSMERHSEQSDHAVGRGNRRGERLSQTLEPRQRQYPRPPGPARYLRAQ